MRPLLLAILASSTVFSATANAAERDPNNGRDTAPNYRGQRVPSEAPAATPSRSRYAPPPQAAPAPAPAPRPPVAINLGGRKWTPAATDARPTPNGPGQHGPAAHRPYPQRPYPQAPYPQRPHHGHYDAWHAHPAPGPWVVRHGPRYSSYPRGLSLGVVVHSLPTYYSVRRYGGSTYYIADDVYYTAAPGGRGYVVSEVPAELRDDEPEAAAEDSRPERLFAYPRQGQSREQQERDEFECYEWASEQSGFDPMLAQGGVAARDEALKRADYQRATEACMDGRGYAMR